MESDEEPMETHEEPMETDEPEPRSRPMMSQVPEISGNDSLILEAGNESGDDPWFFKKHHYKGIMKTPRVTSQRILAYKLSVR